MPHSASTIIIPVEIQAREMDAKILLACVAAERGFPVIMGSRSFIHFLADSVPRGVYLAKSMRTLSIRMFDILRRLGHEIVAWDEEGLLRWPDPEYYRQRLSPVTMGQISRLMAWGPDNARAFRDYPGYNGAPIHLTGNPRIDLLRPELREYYRPQVDALHERYGDFVLVNTNFGLVNHFYDKLGTLKKAVEAKKKSDVDPYDVGKGKHKLSMFKAFQEMLPRLCAAVPGCKVILRPQPAENHAPYLAIAKDHDNLRVVNEGGIVPWLMAARALVANGCTTMMEAAVLDIPIISFQPVVSKAFDEDLPNSLGHRAFSTEELCSKVQAVVQNKLGPLDYAKRREILDQHMSATDGPLAADRMVDVLEAGEFHQRQPPAPSGIGFAYAWLRNRRRTLSKKINMRRPGHRNNLAFHTHRFPDISVEEVRKRAARLGRLLNRFEDVRIEQHSRHIFKMSR